ncbi:hypothetical protein [Vibrio anguillarum]|uniref:hypothetical protein n=1 Tax=Vibrio anguillarum TaxID=55601 RepID=UPI001C9D119F|nr:hypothetical protein [Vibrio anguillarum]MBY7669125.1 hypothetical protein [Vibrio anguillarum]
MSKRPTGLTIFAVLNFIFAAAGVLNLIALVVSPALREQANIAFSAYMVLSPLLTCILMIVSGIGFLKLHYKAGFIGGVMLCLLSLGNILIFNVLEGFQNITLHLPSMVYPTILLAMLLFKYREKFKLNTVSTEQGHAI